MGVVAVVACMPVWHDVWKTSEPLSDLDQWLNIAKRDPNVNAKLVVGVCNAQQRLVHPLPHGLHNVKHFAQKLSFRR